MRGLLILIVLSIVAVVDSAGQIVVRDRFDRDIGSRAIRLIDWEGQIANPAVEFSLEVPEDWLPATVQIAGSNQRLHFADRRFPNAEPNTMTDTGPKLTLQLRKGEVSDPVLVAIWPDRDTRDEAHSLWIGVHTASDGLKSMVVPIVVDDQDRERDLDFQVTLSTVHDKTAFYTNPGVRFETQQAADDWAYFLSDNGLDEVQRGSSRSWIWNPDGFLSGYWVTNDVSYQGFLLYAWGMQNVGLYSGGAASGRFQTRRGWPINLAAAGHVAMEMRGNRNLLGWAFYTNENDWWKNDNHPRGMVDFHSQVHHQIGHALFFSSGHTRWQQLQSLGGSTAARVIDYLGGPAIVDRYDHIYDQGNEAYIVDPASRRGVFGSELASGRGIMAPKRWIITKTDLLMAEDVGYELRNTSPFHELAIAAEVELTARALSYSAQPVSGGVPDYLVEIISGSLPPGLSLNPFTGEVSGVPMGGDATVTLRVTDQIGKSVEGQVTIRTASVLATQASELPRSTSLSNYPNPFAERTVVQFNVAEAGPVSLTVHDMQGREVARLVDGFRGATTHEVVLEASGLAPGVYLTRLVTTRSVETGTLTVVR
ncbi:MAG: T9SS type A sorting domain-containing protein [Rhodothermales bacterium]|nr:T9SS type A sorting domain-containing protein [Rhodothermales bacterium]MBO6781134.1 T9SS type A sorting domain-containing protein [Rhodothermales bacterium]